MAQIMSRALKLARIYYKLEPVEMAAKLNITPAYLNQIESNAVDPTVDLIEQYALVLEVPKEQLFWFSESFYQFTENRREKPSTTRVRLWLADKVLNVLEFILKVID